jgi:hypothetical protein
VPRDGAAIVEVRGASEESATERVPIALGPLGLLGGVDIWIVPSMLLGIPGLLVIAVVALQAAGVGVWIPAIRRLRDDDDVRPAGVTA